MNRRHFIKNTTAIIAAGSLLEQCKPKNRHNITGSVVGANSKLGHLVRDAQWQEPASVTHTGIVIIGGGISGLSAARWLQKEGREDFMLLELDKDTGGNAVGGKNETSAYPWGAHYVPIPNNNLVEYLGFLKECGVITGYDPNGLPFINEYFLCFEPQERLYINGQWQDGLVPDFGVPENEQVQIKAFLKAMNDFRLAIGADGKDAFAIPVDSSSEDPAYRRFDTITMKRWLEENGFNSGYLHWYTNYCCRDDFGTDYSRVSAWAGIHYFAGRKGFAANAPAQSVITWPEGNSWLAAQLRKNIGKQVYINMPATKIRTREGIVEVLVFDAKKKETRMIQAKKCIVATPQFVAARLLDYHDEKKKLIADKFIYHPWMVANVSTGKMEERNGAGLSWDNVVYKGKGLGYVEANHQHLQQTELKKVLTYYYPLTSKSADEERQMAYQHSFTDWVDLVIDDLAPAHSDIEEQVTNIDIWVWGHGMISPQPGFIHGPEKKALQQPINDIIFFAHTDLAGISIFEEAFYQGINAAKMVLESVKNDT